MKTSTEKSRIYPLKPPIVTLKLIVSLLYIYYQAHVVSCFSSPAPIDGSKYWPERFPAKEHCSRCGLCETSFVSRVKESCAFLNEGMKRMDRMEPKVHGKGRNVKDMVWTTKDPPTSATAALGADEGRFGVMTRPMLLAKGTDFNAQWTGCVTGIAISMLQSNMVDSVVCIASKEPEEASNGAEWSEPQPIIARTVEQVLQGRGVKPALAPSLKVLDEVKADKSIERLLFCGVGCAVQAFRAIQDDLDLKEVYVLGTNCADNSPTPEAARKFIKDGLGMDENKVQGYEFMQDFRVHVKMRPESFENSGSDQANVSYTKTPYFCLPGSIAESAIADSCLACFDYTNGLADIVVGYMAAPLESNGVMGESLQSLTIRNQKGEDMVQAAIDAGRINVMGEASGKGSHEKISLATVQSDNIVLAMTGGEVKDSGMPRFMGEIMATVMRGIGPKGVNFARYSIDYHVLRNYLHVLDVWGEERVSNALPRYAKDIVDWYLSDESFATLREKILAKKVK